MAQREIAIGIGVGFSGLMAAFLHLQGAPDVSQALCWGLLAGGFSGLGLWYRQAESGALLALLALGALAHLDTAHRMVEVASMETVLAGGLILGALVGPRVGISAGAAMRAVLGANLTLAGIAKLWASGWGWVDGDRQARLILERGFGGEGMLHALQMQLGHQPWLAEIGASLVLCIELCGGLFLIPQARPWYRFAVAGMFIGLGLLLEIWQPAWIFSALVLGAAQPESSAPPGLEDHRSRQSSSGNPA